MHESLALDQLKTLPLFESLSTDELLSVASLLHPRHVPGRHFLITVHEPGVVVYVILDGTLKVQRLRSDGKPVILSYLGPGDVVGEMSAVDRAARSADVITAESVDLLWMDRRDLRSSMEQIPQLSRNMLSLMASRLREANERIIARSLDVPGRLCHQLLWLAERYGEPTPDGHTRIELRTTQGELAELVDATREHVNRAFGMLRRRGAVSSDKRYRITLTDRRYLEALAEL